MHLISEDIGNCIFEWGYFVKFDLQYNIMWNDGSIIIMKHFRSTSTKLTANSTGDLLAENHILKEEIIKLRKTSKSTK